MYDYMAKFIEAVDGDSVHVDLDLGLHIHQIANCRLFGINAPELNSPDAATRSRAQASKTRLIQLIQGKAGVAVSKALDKYGRPLVTIYIDGVDINQQMIDEGYAVAFMTAQPFYGNEEREP